MKIDIQIDNKTFIISPVGRIATSESLELIEVTGKIPSYIEKVIFNMNEVDYISSSCLRVFLTLRQRFNNNDSISLVNCNSNVFGLIKSTGFDSLMNVSKKDAPFDYSEASFKDVLAYRVKNNSDDIFITYCGKNYSWKDIDIYSQIIANDLRLQGIGELSHVGMICSNSINFVLTFFAIQKLGAIAVFFNDKLTKEEIYAQCDIGDVTSICLGNYSISDRNDIKKELLSKEGVSFVYDISDDVDFSLRKDEYFNISKLYLEDVLPDNPSLMLYSSGSTGKPKAVLLSTRNLMYESKAQIEKWNINNNDSLCLVIPLFHIFAFKTGFVYSMIMNNRICICENTRTSTIISMIEKEKCTLLHTVPTLMLAIINSSAFNEEKLSSLRISVIAGAKMYESQVLKVMGMLPNLHIINLYGLSEINPVSATIYDDSIDHICKSAGSVSSGVNVKIVNPNTKLECKNYEIGEVLVKGDLIFLCYYKLPAEKQAMDSDGFVHTGDVGYFDEDGYLYLTGRIKEIIIRGGENILPNEVADAITKYENIKEVIVLGIHDDFYGEIVTACVSLYDNSKWDEKKLNEFLTTKIASFKIPTKYLVFDSLPKLANGKFDRETMKKELIKK